MSSLLRRESDDGSGSTLTYRELVDEIADAYGGREDLLDRMWLRFGGRPDPAPPPARDAAERCTAPGCDRLAEIAGNLGQLCWPHYETER